MKINSKGILILVAAIAVVFLIAPPLLEIATTSTTVQSAMSFLTGQGYTVLASDDLSTLNTKLDDIKTNTLMFNSAVVYLFPDTTAYTTTISAGATPNTFGAWAEIKDSNNVAFSSVFSVVGGYVDNINISGVDGGTQSNSNWILELSYGGGHIDLARIAFNVDNYGSNAGLEVSQIKSRFCPAGQTIYYRLMSSQSDDVDLHVTFRYFYTQ